MAMFHRPISANCKYYILFATKNRNIYSYDLSRDLSNVPSERKADFFPRVISKDVFPDIRTTKLKRGTGGRSSFNGQIITVFGATGLVGSAIVTEAARHGAQVIIPYRGIDYFVRKFKLSGDLGQILFFPFNLKDEESIHKVMKYSNIVVNCIGKPIETTNYSFTDVHVDGARRIARIAKEIGVKRFVHFSSLSATPNPTPHILRKGSQWLRSKYFGEQAVREVFPDAIVFRPSCIYGLQGGFAAYMLSFQRRQRIQIAIHNGGYDIYKQPVSVRDIAQAVVNSFTDDEAPGNTYEAYGPRRYELRNLIEYIFRLSQRSPEIGYKIANLRWSPMMKLRVYFFSYPRWLRKDPAISWEQLEFECITDMPTGCPTLEDLGVKLSFIEDRLPFELDRYRDFGHYSDEVGEFLPIDPPEVARDIK